jgi:hypothetical protein
MNFLLSSGPVSTRQRQRIDCSTELVVYVDALEIMTAPSANTTTTGSEY